MAYKVKSECVNPANGQRMAAGQFLDPVPNKDEIERLKKAGVIEEVPDAEQAQWKRDEADRQTKAQEDARLRADRPADMETRVGNLEKKVADLLTRSPAPATPPRPRPEDQSNPAKEAAQKAEIDRRAGQRPGDDNDQRKSTKA